MRVLRLKEKYPTAKVELWCEDEHRLGLKPIIRKVWSPIGERPLVEVGLGTVRWTPEGCGDEDPLKGVVSGATDKTTISTGVQGGGREVDALLREAPGADLP